MTELGKEFYFLLLLLTLVLLMCLHNISMPGEPTNFTYLMQGALIAFISIFHLAVLHKLTK